MHYVVEEGLLLVVGGPGVGELGTGEGERGGGGEGGREQRRVGVSVRCRRNCTYMYVSLTLFLHS